MTATHRSGRHDSTTRLPRHGPPGLFSESSVGAERVPADEVAAGPPDSRVRLRVSCPRGDTELITIVGPADEETLGRLAESWPYTAARLRRVVLDLGGIGALGPVVARLLAWTVQRARTDGLDLRVVASARQEQVLRRNDPPVRVLIWHRTVADALPR